MKLFQVQSSGQKLEALLEQTLNQFRLYLKQSNKNIAQEMAVYLREKRIQRTQVVLKKGAVVSLLIPDHFLQKPCFEISTSHVAYEDDDIIVVDKPPRLPTQSTQIPGQDHLYGAVISYLTQKNMSKLAYVGLHHRLDRDTSGLILLTKKTSMNKSISDQFKDHQIKKKYTAIVQGEVPKEKMWTVEAPIARIYGSKEFRFGIDKKKGDEAITKFSYVNAIGSEFHKIECQPITGRTHQIRIHLAHSQLPIVGDRLYGVKSEIRMQLHAYKLQFKHPKTNELMTVESKRTLELEKNLVL